jgi:L-alanine-DL-glutamate epimerase-like enolase superfamily enzyme
LDVALEGIEEPLQPGQLEDCARLADTLGIPIILDESLLRVQQLDALARRPELWILNLRVSKLGGLIRSLEILEVCADVGLRVIVGAQVGETSVLTRAALVLAQRAGARLVAQEGAFGTELLVEDVCDPPLMFGHGGILDPAAVAGRPGLGLAVRGPYR